jgi:hypothetical protein
MESNLPMLVNASHVKKVMTTMNDEQRLLV